MPGRAGQGRVKVEIVWGWGGVAWRGVGFGRVGKGRVGAGSGRGVYLGLGKVGSVWMWVWVGGVGLLPPPNLNSTIPYSTISPLLLPPHPYPFHFYITLSY